MDEELTERQDALLKCFAGEGPMPEGVEQEDYDRLIELELIQKKETVH